MTDTTTDRPEHPWNDPDGDGHNCADCLSESIWKCDEAAHKASQKRTNVCRCGREGCTLPWSAHDWSYLAEREAHSGQPERPADRPIGPVSDVPS